MKFVHKESGQTLKRCSLLAHVSVKNLQQIADLAKGRRVAKGDFFFRKGDHPAKLYVLTQGQVDLCLHTRGGEQVIYKTLKPCDCFGHIAVFGGSPHIFSAQARTEARAIAWDIKALARAITVYPEIVRNSLGAITKENKKLQKLRRLLGQRSRRRRSRG